MTMQCMINSNVCIVSNCFLITCQHISISKCISNFNLGYSLDDLWSRLLEELCDNSFQTCNITFQVKQWLLRNINISTYAGFPWGHCPHHQASYWRIRSLYMKVRLGGEDSSLRENLHKCYYCKMCQKTEPLTFFCFIFIYYLHTL